MGQQAGDIAGLILELKVPERAVLGIAVLATISVSNRGASPVTVSSRLNLMEGDVRLLVTGPDGVRRRVVGAGGQPDTLPRQVTLPPGRQIVGGINLLYTDVGPTFPETGRYILQAEYSPTPHAGWLLSAPMPMTVHAPESEAQRGAAALLQKEAAKLALTLAEADHAPDELRELAKRFPDTLEGKLARLILAGRVASAEDAADANNIYLATDPLTAALLLTSLSTPFSRVGTRLKESYAAYSESRDVASAPPNPTDVSNRERALRMIREQPLEND